MWITSNYYLMEHIILNKILIHNYSQLPSLKYLNGKAQYKWEFSYSTISILRLVYAIMSKYEINFKRYVHNVCYYMPHWQNLDLRKVIFK